MATLTTMQRIAGNLRAEVSRAGYNRSEFAKAMGDGWSPSSTGRRLDGVQPMSIEMLTAVAAKLGVPLSVLLNGVDEPAAQGQVSA